MDCAGSLLRAVEKWPNADEKMKVGAELHRMVALAATYSLAAFPTAGMRSKSPLECTQALYHCTCLCLAVSRSRTHVPACSQAPRLMWLALQGGYMDARGRIETLPLPRATHLLQALAALGTTCVHSRKLAALVVRQAPTAINAAVAESLRCMQPQPLPQLTWWDWVRFYTPSMGLWGGLCAASMAPAPLQHMRGLAVRIESPHPRSHAVHAGIVRSLSLPTASSYRDRRCLPWSVHAAAGVQPVVDSVTLLLHALLTVRLCQAGTDATDELTPAVFARKVRAAISHQDRQVFVSAYAALSAFTSQRPLFPQRLLMVDRVARSLSLLDGPQTPRPAAQGQVRTGSAAQDASGAGVGVGSAASVAGSPAQREWATLAVSPEVFDTSEATSLRLSCLQRVDPNQPSLRVQLGAALEHMERSESRRDDRCCLKRLKHVPGDATDEDVVWAIVSAKRAAGEDQGKSAGLIRRMRVGAALWICDRVAEIPSSVRFGNLLLRLAVPGQFPDAFHNMLNTEVAARLVSRMGRGHGSRASVSFHEALCQAMQAAFLHVSLQGLAPVQLVAFLRLLESDGRCTDLQHHLRPGRKSEGVMRGLLKLLNTQPLPPRAYHVLRELVATAAAVPVQRDHMQQAGGGASADGAAQGELLADLQLLMRQAAEVAAAAGRAKPVAGCQVSRELEGMGRHVRLQALKQGALELPVEMEEWCSATVKSARGTPSELQVCKALPCPVDTSTPLISVQFSWCPHGNSNCSGGSACCGNSNRLRGWDRAVQHASALSIFSSGSELFVQKKIHSGLQVMGFSVIHEHQVETLPMHLDIVTKGRGRDGEHQTVAIEVDGPSHFVHTAAGPHSLNSATRFRNAALLLHRVHVRPNVLAGV